VLVHDVERGKKIELTRRGKRVAVLVSCDEYDRLAATRPSVDQALQAWRARAYRPTSKASRTTRSDPGAIRRPDAGFVSDDLPPRYQCFRRTLAARSLSAS